MTDKNNEPDGLDFNLNYEPESDTWNIDAVSPSNGSSWDEDSSADSPQEPQIPVEDVIRLLARQDELPAPPHLHAFSDLSLEDAHTVEELWPIIPVERRRQFVEGLVREAEVDLRLHLGRFLRIAMHDPDAAVRRIAVQGLWEDDSPDLIGAFTHLLHNDPAPEVRAAAAAALGSFVLLGELEELDASLAMRAEESLLSILRNEEVPIAVQCRALESIAYSGEVGVRDFIEDAYYSPFEEMRVGALNAMGRSADIRWRGLARAELTNPAPLMRVSAAIACGELEAHAAVDELIPLLNDEEQAVRLAAIFALGRLGGKKSREALQEVAASEYEEESEAAEEALEEMLFYGRTEEISLFDESLDVDESGDDDPWDNWFGSDDSDLGTYG